MKMKKKGEPVEWIDADETHNTIYDRRSLHHALDLVGSLRADAYKQGVFAGMTYAMQVVDSQKRRAK